MDEKKHWDKIASRYNEEIFDVFLNDKKKKLSRYFKKHSSKSKVAIDLGCGNGKAFTHLSPLFKKVIGIDISQELLAQAKRLPYSNIELKRLDLSRNGLRLPKADFLFSCNVVMFPAIEKNFTMLKNMQRSLKPGGTALLVLPSLESVLFSSLQLISLYRKEGTHSDHIPANEFDYFRASKRDIVQGIIYIDGIPTKHYLGPEIEMIFRDAGLQVTALEKLEYDWKTEFAAPPASLNHQYPWDWLVECKRK